MARVILAGGAGFLGSHLTDALLGRGDEVVVLDNLVTGARSNVAHLVDNDRFTLVEQDISDAFSVDGDVDVVMNLASPASPPDYLGLPIETLKVGSLGTMHLLELAQQKNATFFMASTSEVYGDPTVHPQTEAYWGNVNPIGPRSCYDEAKRFSEALTMAWRRTHELDTRLVRIFNTYGPRMRANDGRVVSNFIVQALSGQPITIFGDGKQTRSFTYVDDEIRGFLALLDSDEHEPVNIGNPNEFTVAQLAELVVELTNSASEVTYHDLPVDDPMQRQPDITKARELLGWEPTVQLREGLGRTIEYFAGLS